MLNKDTVKARTKRGSHNEVGTSAPPPIQSQRNANVTASAGSLNALHKIDTLDASAAYRHGRDEVGRNLCPDLDTDVTAFFRSPEMLKVLKNSVFPKIAQQRGNNEALRVWL